jgi:hypothetical protein
MHVTVYIGISPKDNLNPYPSFHYEETEQAILACDGIHLSKQQKTALETFYSLYKNSTTLIS